MIMKDDMIEEVVPLEEIPNEEEQQKEIIEEVTPEVIQPMGGGPQQGMAFSFGPGGMFFTGSPGMNFRVNINGQDINFGEDDRPVDNFLDDKGKNNSSGSR